MERTRRKRLNGDNDISEIRTKKVRFLEEVDYKMELDDGETNFK